MSADKDPSVLPAQDNKERKLPIDAVRTVTTRQLEGAEFISKEAEPLHYDEEMAEIYGYDHPAIALAELELAGADEIPESERIRLLLCQDPENKNSYGLLQVGDDNKIVGEYPLPSHENEDAVVVLGRNSDKEMVAALPGLKNSIISHEHIELTISNEGISIRDLDATFGTNLTTAEATETSEEVTPTDLDEDTVPRVALTQKLLGVGDLNDDPAVSRDEYLRLDAEEKANGEIPELESNPDTILREHFDALLDGQTEFEGVSVEVAHVIRDELHQLVDLWRQATTEVEIGEISEEISNILKKELGEGSSLNQLQYTTQNAIGSVQEFERYGRTLQQALYEGDPEYILQASNNFKNAKEDLLTHISKEYLGELEAKYAAFAGTGEAITDRITAARHKKRDLGDVQPTDSEKERLRDLFADGGFTLAAIQEEIASARPKADRINRQLSILETASIYMSRLSLSGVAEIRDSLALVSRGLDEYQDTFNRGVIDYGQRANILDQAILRPLNGMKENLTMAQQLMMFTQSEVM